MMNMPEIKMGKERPDGTRRVIGVDFGEGVVIGIAGGIRDNHKLITPGVARARAAALVAAAEWVETGQTAKLEEQN
jgi:hypothetical protein